MKPPFLKYAIYLVFGLLLVLTPGLQAPSTLIIGPNGGAAADIIELLMATPCTTGVPNEAVVLTTLKGHQTYPAVFWQESNKIL